MKHSNFKKWLLLIFILTITSTPCFSQLLGQTSFGTSNNESTPHITQSRDGGIITVCSSDQNGNQKLLVRKTDGLGNLIWETVVDGQALNPAPDFEPVAIICDNFPTNAMDVYILANAHYHSTQTNDDVYVIKLTGSGTLVNSRRLQVDNVWLGLPTGAVNVLYGYSMIQLQNGSERGDFLIAANLAARNGNVGPLTPSTWQKVTQIIYKVTPSLGVNWGRQICHHVNAGTTSFANSNRNATEQLLELPNGNVIVAGWIDIPQAPAALMTEMAINSSTGIIQTTGSVKDDRSYKYSGIHSISRNSNSGNLYTTYYGNSNSTDVFMLSTFNPNFTANLERRYITSSANVTGNTYAKTLFVNNNNLLFLTSYIQNGNRVNVLGSINTNTWQMNWAKTFPAMNQANVNFALTYDIVLQNSGLIRLCGSYTNGVSTDISMISTVNGPASGACEESVDLGLRDVTIIDPMSQDRAVDLFYKTSTSQLDTYTPVVEISEGCACPYTETTLDLGYCEGDGVWYQPCSNLATGEKYVLTGLDNNYAYDSKLGYIDGNGHPVSGCIAHWLVDGNYEFNFFGENGCLKNGSVSV